jgi:TorA maturation chaperone TorD
MNDPSLAPAARLFGRLLVRELDRDTLAELREPAVREALVACGIDVPAEAELEPLAERYCAWFLHPAGAPPPVQSLWLHGQFDGDAAQAVRAIAAAAGREQAPGARGAPPDQAGCILLLWADLVGDDPVGERAAAAAAALAARLARDHLGWIRQALLPIAEDPGFYGAVARGASALVEELRSRA